MHKNIGKDAKPMPQSDIGGGHFENDPEYVVHAKM